MKLGMLSAEECPIEEYHGTDAITHSRVKFFSENLPITYRQKYIDKVLEPEEPKEHYDIGHACEALLIGTDTYGKTVAVCTQWQDFKSAAARQWRDENRKAGVIPLSKDNDALVHRMRDAVMRNPDAAAIIQASTPQVTFRTFNPDRDVVPAQCRVDFWCPNGVTLPSDGSEIGPLDADLKTFESLSPGAFLSFSKHAVQLKYHWAAVWYAFVIRRTLAKIAGEPEDQLPFVQRKFIVVDKKEYPSCTVFDLPQVLWDLAQLELFREEPTGAVRKLLGCYVRNDWPDAPVRAEIEMMKWM